MRSSGTDPSSPLTSAAASWAPRSASTPAALPDGTRTPILTSLAGLGAWPESDEVHAAATRTMTTMEARVQARMGGVLSGSGGQERLAALDCAGR
jgi:hypothetical protein